MSPASRFAFADILKVLDALPMGVMMNSPEGVVLHLNQALAGLTGFTAADVRGLPCRHILRAKYCVSGCKLGCGSFGRTGAPVPGGEDFSRQDFGLHFSESFSSGGFETDILTLKKRKVPVRLTHFPVYDAHGNELFRLDVVEDLTELKRLEDHLHQAHGHGRLIGRSAAMERILNLIPSIAPSVAPVLITGETGTGKDVLAEALHHASQRSREPFVRLNVSPLPEEMLAPEIFGQVFPDMPERPGRFQQAVGGTLYITEIADIPRGIQTKLVSFLDTGAIFPVGAMRETKPNVRLITATNRNPAELVEEGILSEELFHRLNVVHLSLPPLRERGEDIDFLLRHFLDLFAARFKKKFTHFSSEARALLTAYDYPGNVRELKNIVEYAAMVCPGPEIDVDCLPALVVQSIRSTEASAMREKGVKAPRKKRRS